MFKRANKELAKQSIIADSFDLAATEENFAGVSSDESGDSDIEIAATQNKNSSQKRKLVDHSDSEDDSDSEDENDSGSDGDSDSDEQLSDNEGVDSDEEDEYETVYSCNICPDKRLTTEQRVEEHMKSKNHLRRLRFVQKTLTKDTANPEEQRKRSEHEAQLKQKRQEKNRERIKAKRLAKQSRAYFRKHPEAAAKENTKQDGKNSTETENKIKMNEDGKATMKDKKNKSAKKGEDVTASKDSKSDKKSKDTTTTRDRKSKDVKLKKAKKSKK